MEWAIKNGFCSRRYAAKIMKFKPIVFLKSLNWSKEDLKKFILCVLLIVFACIAFQISSCTAKNIHRATRGRRF